MGNRVSLSFVKKTSFNTREESVTLFSHWRGEELGEQAEVYMEDLVAEIRNAYASKEFTSMKGSPLARLEPSRVMIDFIRWLTKDEKRVDSDLYICKDEGEGDNSDNGHITVHLEGEGLNASYRITGECIMNDDNEFNEQAMNAMQELGLPEDEAERMLEDFIY